MSSNANTPGGEAASAGTVAAHPSPRNDATPKKKSAAMKNLQKLGRSPMLPIAVLPAAALLLRLGQADMLGQWEDATVLNGLAAILAAGGGALFDNLPLLFAVGVHHLLNVVPWFMLGSFEGDTGVVHGDIARFLAGDPTAGAIDFLLNLGIAEKPWAIIVAGLIYAVIYYVIFRFMIVKLDLKTPGRDPEQDPAPEAGAKTEAA